MMREAKNTNAEPEGLIAHIDEEHLTEKKLCDVLEQLADSLLEPLDEQLVGTSIIKMRICIKRHVMLEEKYLYPVLTKRLCPGDLEQNMLEHIRHEHATDESHTHDTIEQLEKALACGRVEKPEMLGYMLRGFFECRRRHIAWEDAVVLPLARYRLTAKDFRAFSVEEFEKSVPAACPVSDLPNCGCDSGSTQKE